MISEFVHVQQAGFGTMFLSVARSSVLDLLMFSAWNVHMVSTAFVLRLKGEESNTFLSSHDESGSKVRTFQRSSGPL